MTQPKWKFNFDIKHAILHQSQFHISCHTQNLKFISQYKLSLSKKHNSIIKNKLIKIEKSKNKRKSPHAWLSAIISYLCPFSFHHLLICFFCFLYSRSNFNPSCVVKIIVYLSCIFPTLLCIHKFSAFLRIFNLSFKRLLSSKLFVFSTLFSKIVSFYN